MKKSKTQIVVEALGIESAAKLVNIRDADILRTPGIGRSALTKIRQDFPFDEENERTIQDLKLQLGRAESRIAQLDDGNIELGFVQEVVAVRHFPSIGQIAIKTAHHNQLFIVHFSTHPSDETFCSDFGFGEITMDEIVPLGVYLPSLNSFERCWIELLRTAQDGTQRRALLIDTGKRIFEVFLHLDDSIQDS